MAKKTSVENKELDKALQEKKVNKLDPPFVSFTHSLEQSLLLSIFQFEYKQAETNEFRNTLRGIIAQIAELEGAISKVDLANRLGCSASALKTRVVDCPTDKLGMVIGKNGSGIKKIEKKSGCLIDIDKAKSQIHLQGSEEAINNAMLDLDDIILSVEESIELSDAVHFHLFGQVII